MESIAIAVEYYQNGIYISMYVYNATLAIVSLFLIMARWSCYGQWSIHIGDQWSV